MSDENEESGTIRPGLGQLTTVTTDGLIKNGDGRTFEFTNRLGKPAKGFIMRWDEGFVAYENRCPHWSLPIGEDFFLNEGGNSIFCPMHGALFDPETGACFSGPCIGDRLSAFDVRSSDDPDVFEIWAKNPSLFA